MKKPVRKSLNPRIQQGYEAECIVAALLPGCIHLNGEKENRLPYDLIWNGIRIDVKSSQGITFNRTWLRANDSNDTVLVYVCLGSDTNYFWVRHLLGQGGMSYGANKDMLVSSRLPFAVEACHKKYSPIYKKTVDKVQS